jgi:hypothetical protein
MDSGLSFAEPNSNWMFCIEMLGFELESAAAAAERGCAALTVVEPALLRRVGRSASASFLLCADGAATAAPVSGRAMLPAVGNPWWPPCNTEGIGLKLFSIFV